MNKYFIKSFLVSFVLTLSLIFAVSVAVGKSQRIAEHGENINAFYECQNDESTNKKDCRLILE
ncbi:MAG: hypothetical protein NC124_02510 [Clostridium sp.]|nr:hypothetical protein [Clostridium sp.]